MSKKFAGLKWDWDAQTGDSELAGLYAGNYATIYKQDTKKRLLRIELGSGDSSYGIREYLKPTIHDHAAQKQALARLRFHVNQWVKRERKKYAVVVRDAKDIIKRMPKK
jgi:hypothetical protein